MSKPRKVKTWTEAIAEMSSGDVVIDHIVGSWKEDEKIKWKCPRCKPTEFMISISKNKYLHAVHAQAYCCKCNRLFNFVPKLLVDSKELAPKVQ